MMIDRWIAEATECDFKVALEVKKPKSWLKSVSAFANGIGGTLFFGIDDGRNVIGLSDAQTDAEMISRLIKERITPYPSFVLAPERENGKDILVLSVSAGRSTPYYYKADGIMEAYIRMGNESVIAPSYVLNQLILKGMHRTYDELISEYDFKDYAFSKLRERYKAWTGNSMEEKLFDSFDMRDENGKLTNAGALLADDSPIRHSRLFCTHWNGLDKSGGMVDALDSAEYSGSLIILLNEGVSFVKRNMKTRWKKTADSRIEMPDYCERSVFEALVNALIHRDYLILGSEVHIDIYDDRLTIYSPGGMPDGTRIQERDLSSITAAAPIFHQSKTGIHRPADGCRTGDAVEHIIGSFLSQMMDQQDGDAVLVRQPLQHGQVPVVIGVGGIVDGADHLQRIDEDQNSIRVR